eukprot:249566_1
MSKSFRYILLLIFILIILLLISNYTITSPNDYNQNNNFISYPILTNQLQHQQMKDEFLQFIAESQSNCSNPKIILLELFGDDIGEIYHFIGTALQTAIASNRILHIISNNENCDNKSLINSFKCIHKPITNCSINKNIDTTFQYPIHPEFSFYRYYLNNKDNITYFNNITWYEILSRRSKCQWFTGIFNSNWFGKYGNVFIRSFVQYYIWMSLNHKTKQFINKQIESQKHENVIAIYVETKDNIEFERNSFLKTLEDDGINVSNYDIVIISNNSNSFSKWQLNDLYDVMIGIEMLRVADYMSGSAKLNVFRLGMELNFATNWIHYDYHSQQTAFSVNIPWIQDP